MNRTDSIDNSRQTLPRIGYWEIFLLWLPLGLSRMMMNIAGPIVNAGISRLPEPTLNLAAYGLIHDMAVLIESPVIMILSASVALAHTQAAFALLRRFVLHLTLALFGMSMLLAFTPLYDLVFGRLLGAPAEVVRAARPAMIIMLFWPPAIGWRRLYQGIIIQYGRSRLITYGTLVRLSFLTLTIIVGVWHGGIPGASLGALALVTSVVAELAVVLYWALPIVRKRVLPERTHSSDETPLTYRSLLRFYWPLAGTEFMRILARPITAAGISRAVLPTVSLAAWPAGMSIAFLFSSAVMSVQEVVLAKLGTEATRKQLSRFAAVLGISFSIVVALIAFTPLAEVYFGKLLGLPAPVQAIATPTLQILILLPLTFAMRDYLRGLLIHWHKSTQVQAAMSANLLVLVVIMTAGIAVGGVNGAILAATATLAAYAVEMVSLRGLARKGPSSA